MSLVPLMDDRRIGIILRFKFLYIAGNHSSNDIHDSLPIEDGSQTKDFICGCWGT